jgi:hypothetical protein
MKAQSNSNQEWKRPLIKKRGQLVRTWPAQCQQQKCQIFDTFIVALRANTAQIPRSELLDFDAVFAQRVADLAWRKSHDSGGFGLNPA